MNQFMLHAVLGRLRHCCDVLVSYPSISLFYVVCVYSNVHDNPPGNKVTSCSRNVPCQGKEECIRIATMLIVRVCRFALSSHSHSTHLTLISLSSHSFYSNLTLMSPRSHSHLTFISLSSHLILIPLSTHSNLTLVPLTSFSSHDHVTLISFSCHQGLVLYVPGVVVWVTTQTINTDMLILVLILAVAVLVLLLLLALVAPALVPSTIAITTCTSNNNY
jgi:hypothetical protein